MRERQQGRGGRKTQVCTFGDGVSLAAPPHIHTCTHTHTHTYLQPNSHAGRKQFKRSLHSNMPFSAWVVPPVWNVEGPSRESLNFPPLSSLCLPYSRGINVPTTSRVDEVHNLALAIRSLLRTIESETLTSTTHQTSLPNEQYLVLSPQEECSGPKWVQFGKHFVPILVDFITNCTHCSIQ